MHYTDIMERAGLCHLFKRFAVLKYFQHCLQGIIACTYDIASGLSVFLDIYWPAISNSNMA